MTSSTNRSSASPLSAPSSVAGCPTTARRLGRHDGVGGWLDRYVGRLEPRPTPTGAEPVLAEMATYADWELHFTGELAEAPGLDVMRAALPTLAPGVMAAATHGWLRTAHAIRSLRQRETPERLAEFARGLAYWAACYQEVPGPPIPTGSLPLLDAVAALPARGLEEPGLIFDSVHEALDDDAAFPAAIAALDPSALSIDGLLGAAASVIRAGGAQAPIVYVHTLTPTASLRTIDDLINATGRGFALGCTWRAVAALIATYPQPRSDVAEPEEVDADDVVDRAVASGDEHAIKVAEAVFGPAGSADPVVRSAAAALVARLT